MTQPATERAITQVARIIPAPRHEVYRACVDPSILTQWRVPDTMTSQVHVFEPHVGGRFRMSLTHQSAQHPVGGKSSEHADTFAGRFVELVADHRIVEAVVFETNDPLLAGEMRITTELADAAGGTLVTITCANIPPGIDPADNELGTRQSLEKLAGLFA